MTTTFYAWANPLSLWNAADHTWVTTYPAPSSCPPVKDYWYCWGSCHSTGPKTTARLLGSQAGNLAYATCICTPNKSSTPLRANGGIFFYAVNGVCHQLANRVLFATGPSPLTVSAANKYWLSHALYGTYGNTHIDWALRKQRCAPKPIHPKSIRPGSPASDLARFDARIKEQIGVRKMDDASTRLHALQFEMLDQKNQLDAQVVTARIRGVQFANRVNNLVSQYLKEVGGVLSAEDCLAIFNAKPGDKVEVVNPKIAAEVQYTE